MALFDATDAYSYTATIEDTLTYLRNEIAGAVTDIAALEDEIAILKERITELESELEADDGGH